MLYKIVQYNSINNTGNSIKHDTRVIKVIANYEKAVQYAINLHNSTGKRYKVERV